MAAEFYLFILEAKNIAGVEKDGTSDPFVEVRRENDKTVAKTKTIKKTINPMWYQDWMIQMKNGNETLTFHLIDHNLIQKNCPIGKVEFHLQEATTGGRLFELPIDTGGHLRFYIRRYPLETVPAGLPSSLEFSRQKIVMDRFVHFAGETIRGMFIWNLSKPKKIGGIKFQFCGRIGRLGEHGRESTGPKTHLLDQQCITKDVKELQAGSNIIPFSYLLPEHMPTSTWDDVFGLRHYYINVIILSENGSEKARISKQIAVLPDLDKLTPRWCSLYQTNPVPPPPANYTIKFDVPKILFLDQPNNFKVLITCDGSEVSLQKFSISLWTVVVQRFNSGAFTAPESWWASKWHRMAKKMQFDDSVKMSGEKTTVELDVKLELDSSDYNPYKELQPSIPPETYPELGESYNFLELKAKDDQKKDCVLGVHPVFVTYHKYYRKQDFMQPPVDMEQEKFYILKMMNDERFTQLNAPSKAMIADSVKPMRLFDDHSVDPYDQSASKFPLAPGLSSEDFSSMPRLETEQITSEVPKVNTQWNKYFNWPKLPCAPEQIKQMHLPKDTGKLNPY